MKQEILCLVLGFAFLFSKESSSKKIPVSNQELRKEAPLIFRQTAEITAWIFFLLAGDHFLASSLPVWILPREIAFPFFFLGAAALFFIQKKSLNFSLMIFVFCSELAWGTPFSGVKEFLHLLFGIACSFAAARIFLKGLEFRILFSEIPKPFRGLPISLVMAAILALGAALFFNLR